LIPESITRELQEFGLTENETKIYIHLAKSGPLKAGEISRALAIHRTEIYNLLTSMQKKGILESTLERPARFVAVSFSKVLESLVETQRQKALLIENRKTELLSAWATFRIEAPSFEREKLQLLQGLAQMYAKATDILKEARHDVCVIASEADLVRADQADFLDQMKKLLEKQISVRLLTEVSKRNIEVAKRTREIETRHIQLAAVSFPHFVMADERELIVLMKPAETKTFTQSEVSAMWTNSQSFIQTLKVLFEELWSKATPVSKVITAIERGEEIYMPTVTEAGLRAIERSIDRVKTEIMNAFKTCGYKVEEKYSVVGDSGATHQFDLGIYKHDKPMVIDVVSSTEPVSAITLITFFTKQFDAKSSISDAILIVKPTLDQEAAKLAKLYQIEVTELH